MTYGRGLRMVSSGKIQYRSLQNSSAKRATNVAMHGMGYPSRLTKSFLGRKFGLVARRAVK